MPTQRNTKKHNSLCKTTLKIVYIIAIIYLVIRIIGNQQTIQKYKEELNDKTSAVETQTEMNEELHNTLDGDDEKIEENILRDQYNYAKPNERIFIDISGK